MVTMVIVMMMYNLMVRTSVKIVDLSYTRKNADCIWLLLVTRLEQHCPGHKRLQ